MKQEKIQMFIMSNQKNFEPDKIPLIIEKLKNIDDDKYLIISSAEYKNPTSMLVISLFLGSFGVDRFMLGDIGMGVLKLLTFGCLGILTIIDWCTIMRSVRQKNFELFMNSLNNQINLLLNSSVPELDQNEKHENKIEELKKYKNLLDSEIITQEEFEKKKKELLQ